MVVDLSLKEIQYWYYCCWKTLSEKIECVKVMKTDKIHSLKLYIFLKSTAKWVDKMSSMDLGKDLINLLSKLRKRLSYHCWSKALRFSLYIQSHRKYIYTHPIVPDILCMHTIYSERAKIILKTIMHWSSPLSHTRYVDITTGSLILLQFLSIYV